MSRRNLRIAVIGHVEHITLGRVTAVPKRGEIAHVEDPRVFPGGGGGVAFYQLCQSDAEIHLFTALGNDDAAASIETELARTRAHVHAAMRNEPHTRDVVMVTPDGERTIVVVGQPLHPRRDDPLPWDLLSTCDAAYFTAQDPDVLVAARAARVLVATARRRPSIDRSGVCVDVVVGSVRDAREQSTRADYSVTPHAVVLTEGAKGGRIETASGTERFEAPRGVTVLGGAYGAGDTFAGALVYYLAAGASLADACSRAAKHGAAVLAGLDPREHQLPLAQ